MTPESSQRIRSLAPPSLAKLFSMWYGFWSLFYGLTFVFADPKQLSIPLGLFIPFVRFQMHFDVNRAATFLGVFVQAVAFVAFCTATGWFSGLLIAFGYNLAFKHFGFHVCGSIESSPQSKT